MCIYRRKLRSTLRKRAARSCCSRPPRRFIRSTARMPRTSAFFTLPAESGRVEMLRGGVSLGQDVGELPIDREWAVRGPFKDIIASGWHIANLIMRFYV